MGMNEILDKNLEPLGKPTKTMDPKVADVMMRNGIPLGGDAALKALASRISNNNHFAQFMAGLDYKNRRVAYEQLRSHLSFPVKSFLQLNAKADKIDKAERRMKKRIYKRVGYKPE
jgi:hypothetical protein